ncbi:MAG: hypothetical protein RhofKO_25650 [Rhodothermales bacterium]
MKSVAVPMGSVCKIAIAFPDALSDTDEINHAVACLHRNAINLEITGCLVLPRVYARSISGLKARDIALPRGILQQVSDAVPPLLAEAVARKVLRMAAEAGV